MTWRTLKRIVLALGLFLAAVYFTDALVARVRPQSSVEVDVFYSILRKDGRTDFVKSNSQDEPCVNSAMSHKDLRPCWYVRSHPRKEVEAGIQKNDFWRH